MERKDGVVDHLNAKFVEDEGEEVLDKNIKDEEPESDSNMLSDGSESVDEDLSYLDLDEEFDEEARSHDPDKRHNSIAIDKENKRKQLERFEDAALNPLILSTLREIGWEEPTPIQRQCLPFSLAGKDVAGFAQTGTGKTGVFLVTLAQKWLSRNTTEEYKRPFAVVLAPTRELAIQIEEDGQKFFNKLGMKSVAIYGGSDWDKQAEDLKKGVDVIMATPGRLRDYEKNQLLDFGNVQLFVCDEVDRMFDMGFIDEVEFFLSKLDDRAQKLIFSATTNDKVEELAFQYLNNPEYISINSDDIAPNAIEQHAFICEVQDKFKLLLGLIKQNGESQKSIIFANTKLTAAWLDFKLKGNNIDSHLITGDLPQAKRIKLIKKIKEGKINFLIATDVASRGIHISGITHVYNFDVPDDAANYVHRIGRTARAGEKGTSYVFVCDEYGGNYLGIQKLLLRDAPVPVWPDQELIDGVEDLSGNPFDKGFGDSIELRGERSKKDRDFRDNRGRDGNRIKDRTSYKRNMPSGGGRHRDDQNAPRGRDDRGRGDYSRKQQGQFGSQGHKQRHYRKDRPYQNQGHKHQKDQRAHLVTRGQQDVQKVGGFLGMLKRIFALIFGRGKTPPKDSK